MQPEPLAVLTEDNCFRIIQEHPESYVMFCRPFGLLYDFMYDFRFDGSFYGPKLLIMALAARKHE